MLFLLGISHNPPAPPETKAQVMVLGTYHMANPGLDLVKVKIRDSMSPERQREIQELVVMPAKFKTLTFLQAESVSLPEPFG
jgi:hypothetical protein